MVYLPGYGCVPGVMIEPTKDSILEFAEANWLVCRICGRRLPDVTAHAPLCGFAVCDSCYTKPLGKLAGHVKFTLILDQADS